MLMQGANIVGTWLTKFLIMVPSIFSIVFCVCLYVQIFVTVHMHQAESVSQH